VAFIRKKHIKGHAYYYLVEGRVVNGKIRQKVIRYLGNPETILERYAFWDKNHEARGFHAKLAKLLKENKDYGSHQARSVAQRPTTLGR